MLVYKLKGRSIISDRVIINGPKYKLEEYEKLSDPSNVVNHIELAHQLLDNDLTRKAFIINYMSCKVPNLDIINHKRFILDFNIYAISLPTYMYDKIPDRMEYVVFTEDTNYITHSIRKYFPKGNTSCTPKELYNVCKYSDGSCDTLEDFLRGRQLDNYPFKYNIPTYLVDGSIKFKIYTIRNSKLVVEDVEIILPPIIHTPYLTLSELPKHIEMYSLKRVIRCFTSKYNTIKPLLDLVGNDWYYISYILYSTGIKYYTSKEQEKEILDIIYDDRILDLHIEFENQQYRKELELKRDLSHIDKLLNERNCMELINYFVYKLLYKIFPNNKIYWMRYYESTIFDKTKFITTHIVEDIRDANVLRLLYVDSIELKTDLSMFNSIEEYRDNNVNICNITCDNLVRAREIIYEYRK